MRATFSKQLIVTTVASAMFATSAFAGCGCDAKGGIPASALLPAIPFGHNVTIPGKHKAAQPAKPVAKAHKATAAKVASARTGAMLHCLTDNGGSGSWTIQWIRGGNGRCPGQILASDAAALAKLADSGKTDLRVAFYIPEKCPRTGWASFPVKAKNGVLKLYPWRKMCSRKGYFKPYAK